MTLTNKLKQMRRREEGFTIVELLIVIIVIAILAALVIAAYVGIQQRARDSERQSDIRNIAVAVQAYATIHEGTYPTCAQIASRTVENIDPDALIPPGSGSSFNAEGESTGPEVYGCEGDADGVRLTWTSERTNAVEERILGEDPTAA